MLQHCYQFVSCSISPRFFEFYERLAYLAVHSLAVAMAACSSSFQLFATSAARGSSGLGAPRRAWIDSRIVLICRAGDQLSWEQKKLALVVMQKKKNTLLVSVSPTFQNIETDATELVDVGMEDFGEETNLGRRHGVVVG